MLGKLLEGAAWCATLTLATAGTLTFVPDGAWETFPSALRPVRAKLADIGVAPTRYRVGNESETAETAETEKDRSVARREVKTGGRNDWDGVATRVRVGERWRNVERIAETSAETEVDAGENGAAFAGVGGRNGAKKGGESANAANDFGGGIGANGGSGDVADDFDGGEPGVGGYPEADAIPPFVETGNGWGGEPVSEESAASPNETGAPSAASSTGFENLNAETNFSLVENALPGGVAAAGVAGTAETAGVAAIAGVAETAAGSGNASTGSVGDDFNAWNDLNATSTPNGNVAPLSPLEGAAEPLNSANSTGLVNPTNLINSVNPANSPVDETAELRSALAAASTASTPEDVKTVFETLNRIRDERGARLAAEDAKTLDAALDRLAFEVFYNPAQAILEPRWTTTTGETLATIAERTATTPETLAAINGLSLPNDAPLPVGTTLKTVRGPASAEISIAKKELTLRFNGLYAGRFALGVPASSANLRGDFRVVEKLANPNCDAVDANGRTISIPGGAPENPLGAAWIALDGGVGLQGTNRPELVGQLVPENGGFVFSDREISQLSVLLPIGAVVSIVD